MYLALIDRMYAATSFGFGILTSANGWLISILMINLRPNLTIRDTTLLVKPKISCRTAYDPRVLVHANVVARHMVGVTMRGCPEFALILRRTILPSFVSEGVYWPYNGKNIFNKTSKPSTENPVKVIIASSCRDA